MSQAIKKQSEQESASQSVERTRNRQCFQPRVDIYELQGELTLVADIPGVESNGIDIEFEKGVLSISARVPDRQPEATRYLLSEYTLGDYHRTFQVSEVVDASRISAEYCDGQLTLHLPKVEAAKPKKIEVKTK